MTDLIRQKRRNRFIILKELYEDTNGQTNRWGDVQKLSSKVGIIDNDFDEALDFLKNEKLITPYGAGHTYHLTHRGKIAIEQVYVAISEGTEYFPSLNEMKLDN